MGLAASVQCEESPASSLKVEGRQFKVLPIMEFAKLTELSDSLSPEESRKLFVTLTELFANIVADPTKRETCSCPRTQHQQSRTQSLINCCAVRTSHVGALAGVRTSTMNSLVQPARCSPVFIATLSLRKISIPAAGSLTWFAHLVCSGSRHRVRQTGRSWHGRAARNCDRHRVQERRSLREGGAE